MRIARLRIVPRPAVPFQGNRYSNGRVPRVRVERVRLCAPVSAVQCILRARDLLVRVRLELVLAYRRQEHQRVPAVARVDRLAVQVNAMCLAG